MNDIRLIKRTAIVVVGFALGLMVMLPAVGGLGGFFEKIVP